MDTPGVRSVSIRDSAALSRSDYVAVEAPLELRFGGKPAVVLMRTPGHDDDLVRGFLFHEGIIQHDDDIVSMDASENAVEVVLDLRHRPNLNRSGFSNSSCGVCGKNSLESLKIASPRITSTVSVQRGMLTSLPERLRAAQTGFAQTGGLHATGLFTPSGELLVLREDVGRHNAFDKATGWALAEGRLPLSDTIAVVSGRVSFELVQKAIVSGVPIIAAIGAPTSLAVDLAAEFGITLVGFLRKSSFNCYAGGERIEDYTI
jgi:FdhD protein